MSNISTAEFPTPLDDMMSIFMYYVLESAKVLGYNVSL